MQSQGTPALRLIRMHPADNVAIVANEGGAPIGMPLPDRGSVRDQIPQGHKLALRPIAKGEAVRRYDVVIGRALRDLPAGSWVNERVLEMPDARSLTDLPGPMDDADRARQQQNAERLADEDRALLDSHFDGYRNADGSVGTRNILGITTTVQCVSGVVEHAVARIRNELLPRFPNVDDVVSIEHGYGCGVAIDAPDAPIPIRTLRNIARNPNFGGELMVVSLGCEKLQPERLLPPEAIAIQTDGAQARAQAQDDARSATLDVVRLQDESHVGFQSMIDSIMASATRHLERLDRRRRERVPVSALVVGVQCGGSDAFSGATANPAVGHCTDLLVRAGATVMFSEVTEVRDGIAQLTARAETAEVRHALIREMDWYDAYLKRGGADRSANTTPGNKKGGLSNIVEKAMGSIVKSGSVPISGVVSPGDRLEGQRGLVYAATPASDFICGTLQLAAGMTLHVFTTGRGTPYGLQACPVIKVATRSELARRWHDLMDLNAGVIADGEADIAEVGRMLFLQMIEVASGRQRTWTERWGLHNSLVLFNPAPVT